MAAAREREVTRVGIARPGPTSTARASRAIPGGRAKLVAALVALGALCALAFAAAPAPAAEEHLLDQVLSLRGDCATSVDDPVPDPGLCPGVPGIDHPPQPLDRPCGVAVDRLGYLYVASPDIEGLVDDEGRIDVFDPEGNFVLQIEDGAEENGPCQLAVDSEGNLFVAERNAWDVALFEPDSYPPTPATQYGPRVVVHDSGGSGKEAQGVAVDPSNDHVYISLGTRITERDSAANGLAPIPGREEIGLGLGKWFQGIEVYGKNHDIYVSGSPNKPDNEAISMPRVFIFGGADGSLKEEIDGGFNFPSGKANVAVDQSNGEVYVVDTIGLNHVVMQFSATGDPIGQFPSPPILRQPSPFADIAIDAPIEAGEAGYESPNEGYAYVTSGISPTSSHLWAYKPKIADPPLIEELAAASIGETEAVLQAELHPGGLETSYRFHYTSQADFEANGYANAIAVPVPDAKLEPGGSFVTVSAPIGGLSSDTAYRFRLSAENEEGSAQDDVSFATYPVEASGLPDGRAYELVTPPDTNGRVPTMTALGLVYFGGFATNLSSPTGESLMFGTEGGALAGLEGGGLHDTYRAQRTASGWQTSFGGITGAQAREPFAGGISADHKYSFWETRGSWGSLTLCPGQQPNGGEYIRRSAGTAVAACGCDPQADARLELIGCGSLGTDPSAIGRWISPDASHVIFTSAKQLEPQTPEKPQLSALAVGTIYDSTPGGTTHVVSLLPGDLTVADGSVTFYRGASADGSAVAFEVDGTTYLRLDNAETLEVTSDAAIFGGFSKDGGKLFYLLPNPGEPLLAGTKIPQGEIFAFDSEAGTSTAVGSGEESVLVNVSADGSHAYFVSPEQLDGSKGQAGEPNLYLWDGTSVRFIATVEMGDVAGGEVEENQVGGIGLWTTHVMGGFPGPGSGPGSAPTRTSPGGTTLLFESHADLTAYQSGGRSQIYRYDAGEENLLCLSCNPTGAAAGSDAQLQSDPGNFLGSAFPPVNAMVQIANLTPDGQRAFFQSADRLVPRDADGLVDVYEWRAQGIGGCDRPVGCLALISSGESASDDYLYAMSADGSDVFFLSSDLLVPQDPDSSPSIYDARVGGGFEVETQSEECLGDACQPVAVAPEDGIPASAAFVGPGNQKAAPTRPRCAKGKRKVRRAGKVRCVKRQRHAQRANAKRRVPR